MTPELVYFFKVNIAIALFYAFYRLFFYKDTFFSWRRTALLCFFAVSLLYPLLNIQQWVKEQEPIAAMADLYANAILPEFTVGTDPPSGHWQEWLKLLSTSLYLSGVLLLTIRFFIQLGSIIRLRIHSPKAEMQGVRVHLLKKKQVRSPSSSGYSFTPNRIRTAKSARSLRTSRRMSVSTTR